MLDFLSICSDEIDFTNDSDYHDIINRGVISYHTVTLNDNSWVFFVKNKPCTVYFCGSINKKGCQVDGVNYTSAFYIYQIYTMIVTIKGEVGVSKYVAHTVTDQSIGTSLYS